MMMRSTSTTPILCLFKMYMFIIITRYNAALIHSEKYKKLNLTILYTSANMRHTFMYDKLIFLQDDIR